MATNDSNDIPQVQDKRPRISGLLPKNSQALVLGGIALVMVLVILFSGHNAPKERPASASTANAVIEPNQARIQDYRARIEGEMRRLAAEEAELTQTKQTLHTGELGRPESGNLAMSAAQTSVMSQPYGVPAGSGRSEPEKNWIEIDRQKREYQSLFSSNVALSYRRDRSELTASVVQPTPVLPVAPTSVRAAAIAAKAQDTASNQEVNHDASQYRLFEGTILETVLTNRLDSSFSGPVNCMLTTSVYSHDGLKLLIPQGTRVLGEVRKLESYGDQRLAVSFHRLIMPDGFSVNLDQFKGLDQIGETGLLDQVNRHYLQVFGVSIALGALAGLSQSNTRYGIDQSATDAYRQGVTGSLSQSATHILDRFLNVLPTFTIREGYRVKVYLSQDLMLPAYDQHPVRSDL